jgi:hypothetical protein
MRGLSTMFSPSPSSMTTLCWFPSTFSQARTYVSPSRSVSVGFASSLMPDGSRPTQLAVSPPR